MPPQKISFGERAFGYFFTGAIDLFQVVANFFIAGIGLNRVLDIIVAIFLAVYFLIRGAKRKIYGKTALLLIITTVLEEIPLFDSLPFWTLDLNRFYANCDRADEEMEQEAQPPSPPSLNTGGKRSPPAAPPLYGPEGRNPSTGDNASENTGDPMLK